MHWWHRWRVRVRALLRQDQLDHEMDRELRFHLEQQVAENVALGMPLGDARRQARIAFGNLPLVREDARAIWGWRWLDTTAQDVRFALRCAIHRDIGHALGVVLILALGLGITTTIWSIADKSLLRPLPFEDPGRLVWLRQSDTTRGFGRLPLAYANFRDWQARSRSFDELAAWRSVTRVRSDGAAAERVRLGLATASLYSLLGTVQHQGSLPQADTDLVLSHTYWTARFGADPEVLGSTLRLDDQIYTIVGILGETFAFPPLPAMYRPDAWASLQSGLAPEARTDRGVRNLWAVGRLTRGVDLDQAQVEMDAIARALEQAHPETNRAAGVSMGPLNTYWNDALQSDMPLILLGAALALLVTCSNVAGLLLSRAMRRTREMAVRAALGAEPLRLARQLATEVGLLVIAGVGVGLACAHAALPVLLRQLPQSVFFSVAPAVDLRVFAIIAVVACATGLLTALALIAGARPGHDASVLSISVGNAPRRPTLRRGLVVVQVGLSMVTVLVGVLLAQSLGTALREPVEFDTANLLALRIALPTELGDDAERRTGLLERIRERAGAIVEDGAAALAASGPFGGGSDQRFYSIAGRPVPEGDQPPGAGYRRVSRNYFDVLGLPMLRGQPLPARTDGVLPVVVNQAFVDLHFPNEDPVGAGVTIFSELQEQLDVSQATAAEIVGVAASEKIWRLDMQPLPQIYAVVGASPPVAVDLLVRTDQPTATLERLRSGLAPLLPGVPLDRVRQIGDDADDTVWGRRLGVVVMNLFAGLALVLAAIGVYGVLSSAVHQRRRELGIRTALGAMPSRLIRLVLRDGLTLATAGVVLGLLGSLVASRFLASFLYGVSATDPLTVVAVTALLLVLATCAAVVPARRAGRTDPATVLREE